MPVGFSSGTYGGLFGNGMTTFVYWGRPKPCIVQLPGTCMLDQWSPLTSAAVASSGFGLILKSHCPFRFMNRGDFSGMNVRASSAVGYGIKVVRAGSLFRLGSC